LRPEGFFPRLLEGVEINKGRWEATRR
jgi:hypothetical protein